MRLAPNIQHPPVFRIPAVYPILDAEMAAAGGHDLTGCARGFAALGLEVQQLRAKTLPARDFLALAERLAGVVPRLIINDRADIARLAGAAGVHLGQEDLPAAALAGTGWEHLAIGVSTHNLEQIEAQIAAGANDGRGPQRGSAARPAYARPSYLAIGPIYATASKRHPDPVVGLEGLAQARRVYAGPLVAIGGITLGQCAAVRRAGADAVAVISALWASPDPVEAARQLLLASA